MMNAPRCFDHIVSRLRTEYPGVKLLALGQTALWDEPTKAILCRFLEDSYPEATMVIGIHDLDYFSKIPAGLLSPSTWAILPHNDFSTKDLWVATGELSRLFGSETIPTRQLLTTYGVQLDRIAKDFPSGREALLDMATEAWGWRGLVHADSSDELSRDIDLADALPHFSQLLEWALDGSLDCLSEADQARGQLIAREIITQVQDYADKHPNASITDLLVELLKKFYGWLLRRVPANLEVTTASSLFAFNKLTAQLPRFHLLRAFLDPRTREICQQTYDMAVENSDTYTLDRFPPGAIPFDLVIPGKGRGTICIRDSHILIDLPQPITLYSQHLPTTPAELADLVESHLGPDVMLIGKAVTLVLMIASEFVFVLNEQASAYVPRCERMASLLKERGLDFDFFPILRIGYQTWDCLSACNSTFRLPGHLAAAFGQGEITAQEFADSWRITVANQEMLLKKISTLTNLDDLLTFLADQQPELWRIRIEQYLEAIASIREINDRAEPMKQESIYLRDLSHQIKAQVQALEVKKGDHFRQFIKPLKDKLWQLEGKGITSGPEVDKIVEKLRVYEQERSALEATIEKKREEAAAAHNRSLELKSMVRQLERSEEVQRARDTVKRIEYEAELARLWLVRDALLVSKGLAYTNCRPTAWWFMLVDPELKWFDRVAETAEFRFEEIAPTLNA